MKTLLITAIVSAQVCALAQTVSTGLPAEPARRGVAPAAGNTPYAGMSPVTTVARSVSSLKAYRDTVPPVQVRFSAVDAKAAQEMEEDLSVMGVLIDQAIDEPQTAMGIDMVLTSGSVRAMYVEGSGALYMIKVNYPMFGPANQADKPENKAASSEWEKARQTLRGDYPRYSESHSSVAFDPQQVEALKKVLINAMKNGANFRHLKPDEHLSFAVFGQPSPVQAIVQHQNASNNHASGKKPNVSISWTTSGRSDPGSVMTLRAQKSDIDAFAKGALDFEAFGRKVTMTTYVGSGHDVTSVNSWVRSGGGGGTTLRLR